ncbi:tyrosinase [Ectocarpus siliculosus]|uniref:Tyrosinase n=1 Tax=Ectocarpus siliculosus TaxID=2880 RepID=D7G3A2_ECTSI|nr:tyrosinase [Ectocarpus siliculosus]|eukprot:CBJ33496.1 tyrosinase [Ectocarpus siliculosus]
MVYSWTVRPVTEVEEQDETPAEYGGPSVDVVFERAPKYQVVLEERASGTGGGDTGEEAPLIRSSDVEVFSKYVRREIRSLFDDERDQMFDAMKVLWDVDIDEGKVLYGPDYLDVWTIDQFHQIGASDLECDHLHDGIGFGITHSMVTMMFENSLQLVNPMLSLPYWDFTIEGAVIDREFGGDYTRLTEASPLWTADWFGGVDKKDYQVKDGRWGSVPVPIVDEDERNFLGADVYGRMRSPWNVNSRPYLTRGLGEMCGLDSTEFYSWPGCSSHYDLQDKFNSYYGYTWWSQYGPHGPVHVWVGGNVDCKKNLDKVMAIVGEEYRLSMSGYLFVKRKDMFRDAVFKCRGFADFSVSEEDIMTSGQCGCLDYDLHEGDDYKKVWTAFTSFYTFDQEFTEEEMRILAMQWCNGEVGMGESSQSSSPLDPTFWSMHPTMERLLVFKLLAGTFTDYSWPDEVGTWVGMDGVEYDVIISTRSDTCNGHRGSDIFPYDIMTDVITPQFTFYGKKAPNTMKNRMLIKLFDPSENALPFIYDNFEWSHCSEMGYDFSDFFDTSTMKSGPKGTAASDEEKSESTRVEGFGLFKQGDIHLQPGFDPPVAVKKILVEREERAKQQQQQQEETKHV